MRSRRCANSSCATRAAMSARCRACSRARRPDLVALGAIGQRLWLALRLPPSPPRQIHLVEFHVELARFADDRIVTGGFGLATCRVLHTFEDVALDRLTGSRIGCAEFLHLFDLFLGKLHRLAVMRVIIEQCS